MRLERLFERDDLLAYDIPQELQAVYGGSIGFASSTVYANFVSSVDGVVASTSGDLSSSAIGGLDPADRFVIGLLRACADVVLIGAGTFRSLPNHVWTADRPYPDAAPAFAELRRRLGRSDRPVLAIVSGSGDIDVTHAELERGAVIFTTTSGASKLGDVPSATSMVVLPGTGTLDLSDVLAELRRRFDGPVLCEGGPTLFSQLVQRGLVDELFLTIAPLLGPRTDADPIRVVTDVPSPVGAELLSLRRHGSHLFLRYGLRAISTPGYHAPR